MTTSTLKTLRKNRGDYGMLMHIETLTKENEKLKNMIHDEMNETSRDIIGLKVQIENFYEFLRDRKQINIEKVQGLSDKIDKEYWIGKIDAYQDVLIELERVMEITKDVGVK